MTTKTFKSTEARIQFREILDELTAGRESVIEHYNRPVGVVIPFAQWQAYKRQRHQRHQEISKRMDEGDYVTLEELEAGLKERGMV
jgi:antitoxin (DNA-binding transcriptional repressor) of toxin-antitoxin stability system